MPTDAPDGLINSHVVQGRTSDVVKASRRKTFDPATKHVTAKPDDVAVVEEAEPVEAEPVVEDEPQPVKATSKKGAGKG